MRILITGGAGCLGSNLIERYLPLNHEILVLDNFATGKREVVPNIKGLTLVEGNIADKDLVDTTFDSFAPTHVIHSAAAYKDPSDWLSDSQTNISGSIHVAEAAKRHEIKKFVNFQTALCYGRPNEVPIPVSHPTQPFTSYGISKTAGEQYLAMSELPLVSLRLANITGPRLAIGPIPTFYKRLKAGQGCFCSETVRDFLDMEDFLNLMDIIMADEGSTGIFNVSTGEGRTIKDVFDVVATHLNVTLDEDVPIMPVGPDDVPAVVLDPAETIEKFNWVPKHDFEATITRMLQWYDKYGVTDIFSHLSTPK